MGNGQSGLGNTLQQGNGNRSNFNWQQRVLLSLGDITGNTYAIAQAMGLIPPPFTYSATMTFVPDVTGANDIFKISGTLGKHVRLRKIKFYATKTVAGVITVSLFSRGSLDNGFTNLANKIKYDAANPNSTANVDYTISDPTLGSSLGEFANDKYNVVATGNNPNVLEYIFGQNGAQLPTLSNDINPGFYLSLNGAIMVGGSVTIVAEWDEAAI